MWKQNLVRVSAVSRAWRAALALLLLTLSGLLSMSLAATPQGGWQKPVQLDKAGWVALKEAVLGTETRQARLTGEVASLGADGMDFDAFGLVMALSGDTAIVGMPGDQTGDVYLGSVYVFVRAGTGAWTLQTKLLAPDGESFDAFGSAVALHGDMAVVGAAAEGDGDEERPGAAYVFTRTGSTWTQQAKLKAAEALPFDGFGSALALSGNTLLVGARAHAGSPGAAYVFTRSGATWTQQARMEAPVGAPVQEFGHAVALHGDTALVAAYGQFNSPGAAYVYTRSGTIWSEQAQLLAPDGVVGDFYASAIALDGDTALVGASSDDVIQEDQGSVHVFTRSGTLWTHQAMLVADDASFRAGFGLALALQGDTALIGSPYEDNVDSYVGSAYVFTRIGTIWTQQQKLKKTVGTAFSDLFGLTVALDGDTLLAAVPSDDVPPLADNGSVFVYTLAGTTWTKQATLSNGAGAGGNQLGYRVAMSGDTAVVGAYLDDVGTHRDQGSVYVYVRSGTSWTQQAHLFAADGATNDQFGWAIAVDGDTLLVGAYLRDNGVRDDQGVVYVYVRSGTTWSLQAQLMDADGEREDYFGHGVALSGDTALIGVVLDNVNGRSNQGSARVYTRIGASWTQQAMLTADDGQVDDIFGFAVALSGDTALVSAPLDDVNVVDQGSAYVYTRSSTSWTQQAKLRDLSGGPNSEFGRSLALLGNTAIVGVPKETVGTADRGAAHIYARVGSTWTQQESLRPADRAGGDQFGFSVALSGAAAVVGAPFDDVGDRLDQGSARVYVRTGTTWGLRALLVGEDGVANRKFGSGVAFQDDTLLIGVPGVSGPAPYGNPDEGAADVYTGLGKEDTTTTVASTSPSLIGEAATISVAVRGSASAPLSGAVTLSASSGESCSDSTPSAGSGANALYECSISFATVGPRSLSASYAGTASHADSDSAVAAVHRVIAVLAVSPTGLPDGMFGSVYDQPLSATGTGSTAPYSFAVSAGTLPPGLQLASSSGALTGTPTAGGSYSFEIRASDSSMASVGGPFTGERSFTLSIAPTMQQPLDVMASPSTIGQGATSTLSTSGGSGTGEVSYAITAGGAFCVVSGSMLTGTGVGSCTVTATKAADANYTAISASTTVSVVPGVDLAVTISDSRTTVLPGSFVEYRIDVSNAGPSPAPGSRLQSPASTGLVSLLWTCTPLQMANCPATTGSDGIDQLVDLPPGGALRYALSAQVSADQSVGSSITQTASIAVPSGSIEAAPADNTASDIDTVVTTALFADGFEN